MLSLMLRHGESGYLTVFLTYFEDYSCKIVNFGIQLGKNFEK